MLATIGLVALVSVGVWVGGMPVAWHIYDPEGPKTSNVSAGMIMLVFQMVGKGLGTFFWPLVLLFKIVDSVYDLVKYFKK